MVMKLPLIFQVFKQLQETACLCTSRHDIMANVCLSARTLCVCECVCPCARCMLLGVHEQMCLTGLLRIPLPYVPS